MRIALLSDIHGNLVALDAVLADIKALGGVDQSWILGDLVAVGAQPIQVLERLAALPNARFTHGNTDRYITDGKRPHPHRRDVRADISKLDGFKEVVSSISWTAGAVSTAGWMPFLDALPLEQRLTLPDGTRLLGVHASPGQIDGKGLRPDYSITEMKERVEGCDADLLCVGHTHWPMNVQIGDTRAINLGSVGNPLTADGRAWYALLDADDDGYHIRHRRVAYDHADVYATVKAMRHPAATISPVFYAVSEGPISEISRCRHFKMGPATKP
jgi:predicted phosphodiesterase